MVFSKRIVTESILFFKINLQKIVFHLIFWVCGSCIFISGPSVASQLTAVYLDAFKNDPIFKAAQAQWEAAYELAPIAKAALLPSLTGNAGISVSQIKQSISFVDFNFGQTADQYGLNANQAIFNYAAWQKLKNAHSQVKQAYADYLAAKQDLILRVAAAYFTVLEAHDKLVANQAQERGLSSQLLQVKRRYAVGLATQANVEQVASDHALSVAGLVAKKNAISNALEALRVLTGKFYSNLSGIRSDLPFISPHPRSIKKWLDMAAHQNYTLQSAIYRVQAAKENVQIQQGGNWPEINANAGYNYMRESQAIVGIAPPLPTHMGSASLGVSVSLPIYQGGQVSAQVRQAAAQYAAASAQMEQSYREVLLHVREAYLGVITGIQQLRADKQAILSNEAALAVVRAGYLAGTNTITDVLQQQTGLYTAQTQYAEDQYDYLLNLLKLKMAAGTLSPDDLIPINRWLSKPILMGMEEAG